MHTMSELAANIESGFVQTKYSRTLNINNLFSSFGFSELWNVVVICIYARA